MLVPPSLSVKLAQGVGGEPIGSTPRPLAVEDRDDSDGGIVVGWRLYMHGYVIVSIN